MHTVKKDGYQLISSTFRDVDQFQFKVFRATDPKALIAWVTQRLGISITLADGTHYAPTPRKIHHAETVVPVCSPAWVNDLQRVWNEFIGGRGPWIAMNVSASFLGNGQIDEKVRKMRNLASSIIDRYTVIVAFIVRRTRHGRQWRTHIELIIGSRPMNADGFGVIPRSLNITATRESYGVIEAQIYHLWSAAIRQNSIANFAPYRRSDPELNGCGRD